MRWYLHCDNASHPSSCKDFANIDLSFTNPKSWRSTCFMKVGWPVPGEDMRRVMASSWIRAGGKPLSSASVRAELCHWTGSLFLRGRLQKNQRPELVPVCSCSASSRVKKCLRALGPPSRRDGKTCHWRITFLVTSPQQCLWVLWTTYPGLESLMFHTNKGESYFRSRYFFEHHTDCPFWIHQDTGFLEARCRKICSLIKLDGGRI